MYWVMSRGGGGERWEHGIWDKGPLGELAKKEGEDADLQEKHKEGNVNKEQVKLVGVGQSLTVVGKHR